MFSGQRAAGQNGPRPRRSALHAAVSAWLWGLCSPALFGFLLPEFQCDPKNLLYKNKHEMSWSTDMKLKKSESATLISSATCCAGKHSADLKGKLFPVRQGSSGLRSSFSASRSFLTTQTLISGTTFAYSVVTSSINDSVLSHLKCSVCDIYNLWQVRVSRSELSNGTRLHVSCTATTTIKKLSTLAQTTFV